MGWLSPCSQKTGSVSGNLELHSQTLTPSSPPLPSGLSAGSWVAWLAHGETPCPCIMGQPWQGKAQGLMNIGCLWLTDSLMLKSPLPDLSLGFLYVLRVEVIVAMGQLLWVRPVLQRKTLDLQEQFRHGEMKSFLSPSADPACLKRDIRACLWAQLDGRRRVLCGCRNEGVGDGWWMKEGEQIHAVIAR